MICVFIIISQPFISDFEPLSSYTFESYCSQLFTLKKMDRCIKKNSDGDVFQLILFANTAVFFSSLLGCLTLFLRSRQRWRN